MSDKLVTKIAIIFWICLIIWFLYTLYGPKDIPESNGPTAASTIGHLDAVYIEPKNRLHEPYYYLQESDQFYKTKDKDIPPGTRFELCGEYNGGIVRTLCDEEGNTYMVNISKIRYIYE